jgi:hypothetical protein
MSRLTRHRSHVTYVVNLDTLSSTIEPLVRPPFVIMVEAFWLVGLALLTNLLTNVRAPFIVGEEHSDERLVEQTWSSGSVSQHWCDLVGTDVNPEALRALRS